MLSADRKLEWQAYISHDPKDRKQNKLDCHSDDSEV